MTWSRTRWRRVAGVLLLVGVGVLATGTDSAASSLRTRRRRSLLRRTYAPAAWPGAAAAGWGGRRLATAGPGRSCPDLRCSARFDPPEVRWGAGHRGVDLGATVGQEVLAPTAGVVTFRGVVVDRGVLVIETVGGLRTTFEPVDSSLTVGIAVTQGQAVAPVAAAPGHCAPATCLHWGARDGERYLDPLGPRRAVRVVLLPLRPP